MCGRCDRGLGECIYFSRGVKKTSRYFSIVFPLVVLSVIVNFVLERALLQNTGGCLARRQILYKSTAATSYQVQPTGTFYESGHLILRSFLYRTICWEK